LKIEDYRQRRPNGELSAPVFMAQLLIIKDVNLWSLSSILRHPLRWYFAAQGESPETTAYYSPVLGLSSVDIGPSATFSIDGGTSAVQEYGTLFRSQQNKNKMLCIEFRKWTGDKGKIGRQVEALRTAAQLMLSDEHEYIPGQRFELFIGGENIPILDACLSQVSTESDPQSRRA
jgi:hypothetical protein